MYVSGFGMKNVSKGKIFFNVEGKKTFKKMMISPICTKELVDYLGKLVTIVTIRQSVFFHFFSMIFQ